MERFGKWMAVSLCLWVLLTIIPGQGTTVAGTPIHVNHEVGGWLYQAGQDVPANEFGAFYYNNTAYASNPYYAHLYFTHLDHGYRLVNWTYLANHTGSSGLPASYESIGPWDLSQYVNVTSHVSHRTTILGNFTEYKTTTVDYHINVSIGGYGNFSYILTSRGLNAGVSKSYFQCFLGMDNDTESMSTSIDGMVWTMRDSLTTAAEDGEVDYTAPSYRMANASKWYWFDINGGSDQGGVSLRVLTATFDLGPVMGASESICVERAELVWSNWDADNSSRISVVGFEPKLLSEEFVPRRSASSDDGSMLLIPLAIAAIVLFLILFVVIRSRRRQPPERHN